MHILPLIVIAVLLFVLEVIPAVWADFIPINSLYSTGVGSGGTLLPHGAIYPHYTLIPDHLRLPQHYRPWTNLTLAERKTPPVAPPEVCQIPVSRDVMWLYNMHPGEVCAPKST